MRRLLVSIALLLAVMRVPGAFEVAESLVHAVSYGHWAHDASSDGAAPGHDRHSTDPEHGCAGEVHVCMCCGHAQLALPMTAVDVPHAMRDRFALLADAPSSGPHGVRASVFRPPIV